MCVRCKGSTKRWENQNQREDNTYHYCNIYEEYLLWIRIVNSTDCKGIIVHSIDAVDADAVGPASTRHCFALELLLCQKPHTTNRLLPLPGPRSPPLPLAAAAAFSLDQLRLQPPQLLYPPPQSPPLPNSCCSCCCCRTKGGGEGRHVGLPKRCARWAAYTMHPTRPAWCGYGTRKQGALRLELSMTDLRWSKDSRCHILDKSHQDHKRRWV